MTLDQIIKSLPDLSVADRQRIVHACKALGGMVTNGNGGNGHADAQDWMLDLINRRCFDNGLPMMPLLHLRKLDTHWSEKKTLMERWLTRVLPNSKQNERASVVSYGLQLLLLNLEDMGITVSHGTVMRHFQRLPSCINKAFPGYARAGLLPIILGRPIHVWSE